jgi:uncharacterized protein (DUF952 family)
MLRPFAEIVPPRVTGEPNLEAVRQPALGPGRMAAGSQRNEIVRGWHSMAMVYKVLTVGEWDEARRIGRYRGSADDERDGYIHLSTAAQLAGTLARHFAGRDGLVLVAIDPARLGPALRWEQARNGSLFPHLYGELDPSLARSTQPLPRNADGQHILPEGLA